MPGLRELAIVSSTVITALLALPAAATASTGPPTVRAGGTAAPTAAGSNDFFNSDSCTSSTFCMAVGDYNLNGRTPALSEILKGRHWVARSVPSPSHGSNIFANEVSCASPTRCVFVGDHFIGNQISSANLAEAWNGTSWRIITATGPAGSATSLLTDVSCPATTFCMAVGQAGSTKRPQATAYTWKNGTTWRQISVPHPGHARTSDLAGLACIDASNCVAVGNWKNARRRGLPFAARWQDGRWTLLSPRFIRRQHLTTFQAISCPAVKRCVAVGDTEDKTRHRFFHAFAEVWNGSKWSVSTLRHQHSFFLGVSCPTANRCFASGYAFHTFSHPLIETWNGHFWTTQHPKETSAPRAGDILPHVSCVSPSHCESVGYSFKPGVEFSDRTLAEVWNGHDWKVQATANP